jgi:hypothetical protein
MPRVITRKKSTEPRHLHLAVDDALYVRIERWAKDRTSSRGKINLSAAVRDLLREAMDAKFGPPSTIV